MPVFTSLLGKESGEGKLGPCDSEREGSPTDAGALLTDWVATGATCWGSSLIYRQGQ